MSLLTEEIKKRFREIGSQEEDPDPIVVCKLFTPSGSATWYVTEYLEEENLLFGYVQGLSPQPWDDEWGYSSLSEIEAVRVPPFGLPIERDLYFEECRFSEIKDIRKGR
jgi:hypothetical protein